MHTTNSHDRKNEWKRETQKEGSIAEGLLKRGLRSKVEVSMSRPQSMSTAQKENYIRTGLGKGRPTWWLMRQGLTMTGGGILWQGRGI